MKNTLKKILSVLTVAVILLSTLPISASAAITGTFSATFHFNKSRLPSGYEGAASALSNLQITYVAPMNGAGGYTPFNFSGDTPVISSVGYGGDFTTSIIISNDSYWEFSLRILAYDYGTVCDVVIPAKSGNSPGVFEFDFQTVLDKYPSSRIVFFDFNLAFLPVYRPDYNDNYALIKIYTGTEFYGSQKVYAPQETIGSWSEALYVLERDGSLNLPDVLNGYKIDKQEYGLMTITVDPDVINTYNVYYDLKLNSSYTIVYAVTPNGRKEISRLYAPDGWIGDYVYEVHDLAQDVNIIPTFVDGYSFNYTVSPEYVTVYADRVTEVDLYYTDIGADKTIKINYYDQNGKILNQVEYRVSSLSSSYKIPSRDGYLFAPSSVQLTLGLLSESFNVYMIDFTGEREAAYRIGFGEGQSAALSQFNKEILDAQDRAYSNGYQVGLEDGYNNNERFQSELSRLRKEYNIFTAFFDGIFGGLNSSYDTIVDGIAIGGINLRSFIATILVAIICYFVIKVLIL